MQNQMGGMGGKGKGGAQQQPIQQTPYQPPVQQNPYAQQYYQPQFRPQTFNNPFAQGGFGQQPQMGGFGGKGGGMYQPPQQGFQGGMGGKGGQQQLPNYAQPYAQQLMQGQQGGMGGKGGQQAYQQYQQQQPQSAAQQRAMQGDMGQQGPGYDVGFAPPPPDFNIEDFHRGPQSRPPQQGAQPTQGGMGGKGGQQQLPSYAQPYVQQLMQRQQGNQMDALRASMRGETPRPGMGSMGGQQAYQQYQQQQGGMGGKGGQMNEYPQPMTRAMFGSIPIQRSQKLEDTLQQIRQQMMQPRRFGSIPIGQPSGLAGLQQPTATTQAASTAPEQPYMGNYLQ
jgi:hypothetical protein